jgi:hypothetical protein
VGTQEWGTEVLVSVPVKFAAQVVEYLDALKEGRTVSPSQEADAVVVHKQGPWDENMVRQLAGEVSYVGVLALLDRCAETPGEWVSKSEVEESLGMDPLTLRNQLGALSKAAKRLFGRVTWPVEWKKEQDGKYIYRMDGAVAKWWTDARRKAA